MRLKKESPSRYLVIRNWLNVLFIALALIFIICCFLVENPLSNIYCILSGIVAVLLKMGEAIIRVFENLQDKKQQERNSNGSK